MVFRDMAAFHGVTAKWLRRFCTDGDYFAWGWTTIRSLFFQVIILDSFAFFGSGVYNNTDAHSKLIHPVAGGRLLLAGEATSACHACVSSPPTIPWARF